MWELKEVKDLVRDRATALEKELFEKEWEEAKRTKRRAETQVLEGDEVEGPIPSARMSDTEESKAKTAVDIFKLYAVSEVGYKGLGSGGNQFQSKVELLQKQARAAQGA